jgi:hypothetical protein
LAAKALRHHEAEDQVLRDLSEEGTIHALAQIAQLAEAVEMGLGSADG